MAHRTAPSDATAVDDAIRVLAAAIAAYLERHPHSADTAEGIRQWWLRSEGLDPTADEVEQALTLLENQGTVEQRRIGQRALWRRSGTAP